MARGSNLAAARAAAQARRKKKTKTKTKGGRAGGRNFVTATAAAAAAAAAAEETAAEETAEKTAESDETNPTEAQTKIRNVFNTAAAGPKPFGSKLNPINFPTSPNEPIKDYFSRLTKAQAQADMSPLGNETGFDDQPASIGQPPPMDDYFVV